MHNGDESVGRGIAKRFMFIHRKAPHGTIYAWELLEAALTAAAFAQHVTLVFIDDGVYQLKKNQDTTGIGVKDFSPVYRALEDYEIEKVFVERESVEKRALSPADFIIPVEIIDSAALGKLMACQDVIL
ncbi:MAG: sulfurtransferase complex subunit TusC [Gammaproteobacteria bacterium]